MEDKRIFKIEIIIVTLVYAAVSVACDVSVWFLLNFPESIPLEIQLVELCGGFAFFWHISQFLLAPILFLVSFMGYPGKGGKLLLLAGQLVLLATWFLCVWNMWTVFLHIGSL